MKDVTVRVTSVIPQATTVSVSAKLQNDSVYDTEYTVYGNGTVMVKAKLAPSETAPSQLGEFGMWMQAPGEYENMTWYGRGPSETYWNRKAGNMAGVFSGSVTDQFVPYVRIQENGNKTDVRWLALLNDEGDGLLASMVYGGDMLEAVAKAIQEILWKRLRCTIRRENFPRISPATGTRTRPRRQKK